MEYVSTEAVRNPQFYDQGISTWPIYSVYLKAEYLSFALSPRL
jgi:hypothetical protein